MKYIYGNWKMNKNSGEIKQYIATFKKNKLPTNIKYGIAVPFPYINELKHKLGKKCLIGAENVAIAEKGAYTGEVSANMLKDIGTDFCLVGHSERRNKFNESDEDINKKLVQLLMNGIPAVLCVGETEREYKDKKTKQVLKKQLKNALKNLEITNKNKLTIAYEPVWAIGTGLTPTSKDIEQCVLYIKKVLQEIVGDIEILVLYGGSVKEDNATELLSPSVINGALVGGASLEANGFIQIGKNLV